MHKHNCPTSRTVPSTVLRQWSTTMSNMIIINVKAMMSPTCIASQSGIRSKWWSLRRIAHSHPNGAMNNDHDMAARSDGGRGGGTWGHFTLSRHPLTHMRYVFPLTTTTRHSPPLPPSISILSCLYQLPCIAGRARPARPKKICNGCLDHLPRRHAWRGEEGPLPRAGRLGRGRLGRAMDIATVVSMDCTLWCG